MLLSKPMTCLALLLAHSSPVFADKKVAAKKFPPATARPTAVPGISLNGGTARSSVAAMPRVYAPTRPREVAPRFPWRANIVTTIFWIGESPTEKNPTPNYASSWDVNWQRNFGGFDNPERGARSWDFRPKEFVPQLNPFYIALPFNDLLNSAIAKRIPWYTKRKAAGAKSVCKGVWLAVRYGNKTCFAQWEDCGPFQTNDYEYVFGGQRPATSGNGGAGLDVSPAVRDFLGISSGALCDWRFADESEVPDGPWMRFGSSNTLISRERRESDAMKKQYADLVRRREEWLRQQALKRQAATPTPPRRS